MKMHVYLFAMPILKKIQKLTAAVKKLKAEGVEVQANSFTQFQMDRSGFVVEPVN
jgi:hypothetical protein